VSVLTKILIEISPGELIDRTTILRLKSACIKDPQKLTIARMELDRHEKLVEALTLDAALHELINQLLRINARLWEVEEDIRGCESAGDFGPTFIKLARCVYRMNDARAATKREIDRLLGSPITEVKSYGAEES